LKEVAVNNIIPKDAFKGFSDVYGKFVDDETLKQEYLQFSKSYLILKNYESSRQIF